VTPPAPIPLKYALHVSVIATWRPGACMALTGRNVWKLPPSVPARPDRGDRGMVDPAAPAPAPEDRGLKSSLSVDACVQLRAGPYVRVMARV
jgi:hypothetical protein